MKKIELNLLLGDVSEVSFIVLPPKIVISVACLRMLLQHTAELQSTASSLEAQNAQMWPFITPRTNSLTLPLHKVTVGI